MIFQISTVPSTGASDTSVPVTTWNPFGYPKLVQQNGWRLHSSHRAMELLFVDLLWFCDWMGAYQSGIVD
jgi:hypothetical protein